VAEALAYQNSLVATTGALKARAPAMPLLKGLLSAIDLLVAIVALRLPRQYIVF
jgi:hypothetical protein